MFSYRHNAIVFGNPNHSSDRIKCFHGIFKWIGRSCHPKKPSRNDVDENAAINALSDVKKVRIVRDLKCSGETDMTEIGFSGNYLESVEKWYFKMRNFVHFDGKNEQKNYKFKTATSTYTKPKISGSYITGVPPLRDSFAKKAELNDRGRH